MNEKVSIEINNSPGGPTAIFSAQSPLITDVGTALDFLMSTEYCHGTRKIVINKEAISEDFFELRTGLAGEIMQKLVNYRFCLAIYGDFSSYTSRALQDFIYESNQGQVAFFLPDVDTALAKLRTVQL